MFKNLVKKLRAAENGERTENTVISPIIQENENLKKLSKHALSLYERQSDINNFKKLVLSDPENLSHNTIVDELFSRQGVRNPFSDEALLGLINNKRFLDDLGL